MSKHRWAFTRTCRRGRPPVLSPAGRNSLRAASRSGMHGPGASEPGSPRWMDRDSELATQRLSARCTHDRRIYRGRQRRHGRTQGVVST